MRYTASWSHWPIAMSNADELCLILSTEMLSTATLEVILNLLQHVQYVTNYRLLATNSFNTSLYYIPHQDGNGLKPSPHTIQNLTQVTHNKQCMQLLYIWHVDTIVCILPNLSFTAGSLPITHLMPGFDGRRTVNNK
jgi:hypothetical protein